MKTLEQLQAELTSAQEAALARKLSKVQEFQLKAQLRTLTDEALQDKKAQLEYLNDIIQTVQFKIEAARQSVEDLQLMSVRNKLISYNTFGIQGYGKLFELITGMVAGLIYTREDARTEALNVLGISTPLAQELMDCYVQNARYNEAEAVIEMGTAGNMQAFLDLMPLLSTELGVSEIQFAKVPTQQVFDDIHERSVLRAEADKLDHEAAERQWEQDANKALKLDLGTVS